MEVKKKLVTFRYLGRAWSGDSMPALSDTILLTDMESKRDSTDELSLLYLLSLSKIEGQKRSLSTTDWKFIIFWKFMTRRRNIDIREPLTQHSMH